MQFNLLSDWDDLLNNIPEERKDIYFTKGYVSLYENEHNKAVCVSCIEDSKILLMPFLRSEINGLYDFETAYGYGGPISSTDDLVWNRKAFSGIHELLKENRYLCGFTRFHPLLNNQQLVYRDESEECMRVVYDRQTIAIDTSQSPDDIWMKQISSKNRNMIRKAEKNGLEFRAEYDFESYDEFIELYNATMQRLEADEFYFFDHSYYVRLKEALAGNSFLGTIRKDGKLICAAIFMYSKAYGHYHLEGSDKSYSSLGANNLLLWKVACEMHGLGIKEFHLGGGTGSSQDDPLFKFKKAFSNNEKSFYIGKEIFRESEYSDVCADWEKKNPQKKAIYGNRLLKYRY